MSRRSRQSSTILPRPTMRETPDEDEERQHSFDSHSAEAEILTPDLQYVHTMITDQFRNSSALTSALLRLQHDDVTTADVVHEMCPEDFSRLGISCGHRIAIVKAAREMCGLGNSIGGASVSPSTGGGIMSSLVSRSNQIAKTPIGSTATLSRGGSMKGKSAQDVLFGQKPFTGKKVCATLSTSTSSGGQHDVPSPQLKKGEGIGEEDEGVSYPPHEDTAGQHAVVSPHDRDDAFDTLGSSFASLMEYVETSHAVTKERYSTSARCEGGNPVAPPQIISSLHISTRSNPHDRSSKQSSHVRWEEMSGYCPTLREFLIAMREAREQAGFPSLFDRIFYDNKPMPFVEISQSQDMAALLLRIPDLTDEDGTSITTITNRVCFMINFSSGVM